MPALIAAIAGFIGQILTGSVLRFTAYKVLALGIFTMVLPVVLNTFIHSMLQRALNWSHSALGDFNSTIVDVFGMGAWIAIKLQLPAAISIVLGFVAARYAFKLLRII